MYVTNNLNLKIGVSYHIILMYYLNYDGGGGGCCYFSCSHFQVVSMVTNELIISPTCPLFHHYHLVYMKS